MFIAWAAKKNMVKYHEFTLKLPLILFQNVFLSVTHGTSEPAKFLEMYVNSLSLNFFICVSSAHFLVTITAPQTRMNNHLHLSARVSPLILEASA